MAITLLAWALAAQAPAATTVGVDDGQGFPGDSVVLPLLISDASGLESADIQIHYDSSVLDALVVEEGDILESRGDVTLIPNIDDASGDISIVLAVLSPLGAESGALLDVTFAIDPGAAPVVSLVDLIEFTINEGSIDVTPLPMSGQDATDGDLTVLPEPPAAAIPALGLGTLLLRRVWQRLFSRD